MAKGQDSLGDRMKQYEAVSQLHLMRRTPVIIRLDGKAFHTYSRQFKETNESDTIPFNETLSHLMTTAAEALVAHIQNCEFAYTQSDEISLILKDWSTLESQPWYGNNLQKLVSVAASIATASFNYEYATLSQGIGLPSSFAMFDARAYNLPISEVTNYMIWRQQDAMRNSIQMIGHANFSQRVMTGVSNIQVKKMLVECTPPIIWDELPVWMQRGICVRRTVDGIIIDRSPPIFTENRTYIQQHVDVDHP